MDKEQTSKGYKDLIVWNKAMDLVDLIYSLTKMFPKEEIFGITSQMRRSAVSIPSNIAEGRSRGTRKDYRQFLITAYGSAAELETQIAIAKRQRFGKEEHYTPAERLLDEVMRMLKSLIVKLALPPPGTPPHTSNLIPRTSHLSPHP